MTQPIPHCGACGYIYAHTDTDTTGFMDEVLRHTCEPLDLHAHTALNIANQ